MQNSRMTPTQQSNRDLTEHAEIQDHPHHSNVAMKKRRILIVSSLLLTSLISSRLAAEEVRIAVAGNFTDVTRQIAPLFEQATGHTTRISYGSTGTLFSQIENGAPFDLFLAADTHRPVKAEAEGLAVPGSRFIYARGKLVLWSANQRAFEAGESFLKQGEFAHVAIANPETAPYGLAARQVMEHLGVWEILQPRLVRGDSIAQTFQFVATGNANIGFVACSQVRAWQKSPGTTWEIPADYHDPIDQAAVLLKRGENNPAALAFLGFLQRDSTRAVIEHFGYGVG
jgi:molybdate transport system substrate-binding protein